MQGFKYLHLLICSLAWFMVLPGAVWAQVPTVQAQTLKPAFGLYENNDYWITLYGDEGAARGMLTDRKTGYSYPLNFEFLAANGAGRVIVAPALAVNEPRPPVYVNNKSAIICLPTRVDITLAGKTQNLVPADMGKVFAGFVGQYHFFEYDDISDRPVYRALSLKISDSGREPVVASRNGYEDDFKPMPLLTWLGQEWVEGVSPGYKKLRLRVQFPDASAPEDLVLQRSPDGGAVATPADVFGDPIPFYRGYPLTGYAEEGKTIGEYKLDVPESGLISFRLTYYKDGIEVKFNPGGGLQPDLLVVTRQQLALGLVSARFPGSDEDYTFMLLSPSRLLVATGRNQVLIFNR